MKLPPFALERYFAAFEFTAPILLCASDCETLSLGELLDLEPGSRQAFETLSLGYTDARGGPELRRELAGLYATTGPEDILVHVGAEEAILTFGQALFSPGDRVVVQAPRYQSLAETARHAGAEVDDWVGDPEAGFALDPDDLKRLITPKTRAVVVNCPHNPSGWIMDRERFEALIQTCRRHGLVLFSDEVYRFMEHDPARALPPAVDLYERAVSLGVLSKSFGLAGLRVGYAASRDTALLGAMAEVKDYLSICGAAPSEFLAALAIRRRDKILARTRGIVLANARLLHDFFTRFEDLLRHERPAGGPICFPRLRGLSDAEPFSRRLLSATGVLLLPGAAYGPDWAAHVRIGFGRANFAEGLELLAGHLEREGTRA